MNKRFKFKILSILLLVFFPSTVFALHETVRVEGIGHTSEDIRAHTTWYEKTGATLDTSAMKTAKECESLGGTYDKNNPKYKFKSYKMTCSVKPPSGYDYCTDITFGTGKTTTCEDALKLSTKIVKCGKDTSNGLYDYTFKKTDLSVKNVQDYYSVFETSVNNISFYKDTVMSWTKAENVPYYSCKWGTDAVTEKSEDKNISQPVYRTTNGDDAYCIHPGRPFQNQNYHLLAEKDVSKCKSSLETGSPECGLAAIIQEVDTNYGGDYLTATTALRLWASVYELNMGDENWWDSATNTTYSNANLYKNTANLINRSGYSGSTTSPQNGVLFGSSTALRNAIAVFKKATAGIDLWNPSLEIISPSGVIDPSKGTVDIVLQTDFTAASNVLRVRATNNAEVTNHSYSRCSGNSGKYCIKVTVNTVRVNSDFDIEVFYNHPGDIISKVGYYVAENGGNYQNMVIYEKNSESIATITIPVNSYVCKKVSNTVCFDHLGKLDCASYKKHCTPSGKCPDTNISYNMPKDCEKDGSIGSIVDPTICTVLNANSTTMTNYNYDYKYGNEYCDVYCRDRLDFTFMDKEEVLSGRQFKHNVQSKYSSIKHLSTVILASRQCASLIDYAKWKSDYIAADKNVLTTWNTFKKTESQNRNTVPHSAHGTCAGCPSNNCCDKVHNHPDGCTWHSPETTQTGVIIKEGYWDHKYHCVYGPGCGTRQDSWTWYTWEAYYRHTTQAGALIKSDVSGFSGSAGWAANSCQCNGVCPCRGNQGSIVTIQEGPYLAAVKARQTLINKIKSCNFYTGSDSYKALLAYSSNSIVDMQYDENTLYNEGYDISIANDVTSPMVVRRGYSLEEKWSDYCGSCTNNMNHLGATTEEHLNYWECSGRELTAECHDETTMMFPKNEVATITVERESIHYQESQFYTQIYSGAVETSSNGQGYWMPLDAYSWPVAMNRLTGSYDIDVDYRNIGDEDRKNAIKFESGDFTCAYQAINDLAVFDCDDGYHNCYPCDGSPECIFDTDAYSIGVYFRSVDLTDVFPNSKFSPYYKKRTYSIRPVGANWSTANAQKVISEIQALGENVYLNEKPQFVITLEPIMMNKIRDYNDSTTYLDYSLNCGSDLHCTSTFLSKGLKDILSTSYGDYYTKKTQFKPNHLYYYKK